MSGKLKKIARVRIALIGIVYLDRSFIRSMTELCSENISITFLDIFRIKISLKIESGYITIDIPLIKNENICYKNKTEPQRKRIYEIKWEKNPCEIREDHLNFMEILSVHFPVPFHRSRKKWNEFSYGNFDENYVKAVSTLWFLRSRETLKCWWNFDSNLAVWFPKPLTRVISLHVWLMHYWELLL